MANVKFLPPPPMPVAPPQQALAQYQRRMALAQQAAQAGASTAPVRSPMQGIARLGNSLAGAIGRRRAGEERDAAIKASQAAYNTDMGAIIEGLRGTPPVYDGTDYNQGTPAPSTGQARLNMLAEMLQGGQFQSPQVQQWAGQQVIGGMLNPPAPVHSAEIYEDPRTGIRMLRKPDGHGGFVYDKYPGAESRAPRPYGAGDDPQAYLRDKREHEVSVAEARAGNPSREAYEKFAIGNLIEYREQAKVARGSLRTIDQSLALLDEIESLGDETGLGSEFKLKVKKLAKLAGVTGLDENISASEMFKVVAYDFVQKRMEGTKGAITEYEMELFRLNSPGMAQSLGGNRKMLSAMKEIAHREVVLGKLARQHMNQTGSGIGLEDRLDEWRAANPFMVEKDGKLTMGPRAKARFPTPAEIRKAAPPGGEGPAQPGATGATYRPDNPFAAQISAAAARHGIEDPSLLTALVEQESDFNPNARGAAGEVGLGQLMPGTAKYLGVTDPSDPEQNLDGAARYLKEQLDRFDGDVGKALMAYNAGPGAVSSGRIPKSSRAYARRIMGRLDAFRQTAPAAPQQRIAQAAPEQAARGPRTTRVPPRQVEPQNVTGTYNGEPFGEDDIRATMQLHDLTREEVLQQLREKGARFD